MPLDVLMDKTAMGYPPNCVNEAYMTQKAQLDFTLLPSNQLAAKMVAVSHYRAASLRLLEPSQDLIAELLDGQAS